MIPASIRNKNPSAMWPNPLATKFGSTSYETLHDGQGNKIATFPDYVHGGAAQFALWASKNYIGKSLRDAIKKWSGNNSPDAYAKSLAKAIPGLSMDTVITVDFLKSENGWRFMKVQAQWEAGQPYPMTDDDWKSAQSLAFGEAPKKAEPIPTPTPVPEIPKTAPAPAEPAEKTSLLVVILKAIFGRK